MTSSRAAPKAARRSGPPKAGRAPAPTDPVARLMVDVPLPHLDRPFDYLVPSTLDDAGPGRARGSGCASPAGWSTPTSWNARSGSEHEGRLAYRRARGRLATGAHAGDEPPVPRRGRPVGRQLRRRRAARRATAPRRRRGRRRRASGAAQPTARARDLSATGLGSLPGRRPRSSPRSPTAGPPGPSGQRCPARTGRLRLAEAGGRRHSPPAAAPSCVVPDARDLTRLDAAVTAAARARRARRPVRRTRPGGAVPALAGGAPRRGPARHRHPVGGLRPGRRPRPAGDLGRRRRPVRRAAGAVPARPRRARRCARPRRGPRCCSAASPAPRRRSSSSSPAGRT